MDNWASWIEGIGILATAIVALVGLFISLKKRVPEVKSIEAKTNLDETQQAALVREMVHQTEQMYLSRIESFKDDIRLLREELDNTREELGRERAESGLFQDFFFTHHVPWDRQLIAQAREKGWELDEPPSWLMFLRDKEKEKGKKEDAT